MEPLAREDEEVGDATLVEFVLWGGLFVARADGTLAGDEARRLGALVTARRVERALADLPSRERCLAGFRAARDVREQKLHRPEIRRILVSLTRMAAAGSGGVADAERVALEALGRELGLTEDACHALLAEVLADA